MNKFEYKVVKFTRRYLKSENLQSNIGAVRRRSTSWWNSLSIRTKWDLFYKYNPMIANAPANIGLNLNDIEKSHIDEIWQSENVA